MLISELKEEMWCELLFWMPSFEHADSSNGVRGGKELIKWKEDFLVKFGDAELGWDENSRIKIVEESNPEYLDWKKQYFSDKWKFVQKYGSE